MCVPKGNHPKTRKSNVLEAKGRESFKEEVGVRVGCEKKRNVCFDFGG